MHRVSAGSVPPPPTPHPPPPAPPPHPPPPARPGSGTHRHLVAVAHRQSLVVALRSRRWIRRYPSAGGGIGPHPRNGRMPSDGEHGAPRAGSSRLRHRDLGLESERSLGPADADESAGRRQHSRVDRRLADALYCEVRDDLCISGPAHAGRDRSRAVVPCCPVLDRSPPSTLARSNPEEGRIQAIVAPGRSPDAFCASVLGRQ